MKMIAAADRNWAVGKDGKLLVSIPADMRYFREKTMGRALIMGRKTLESFPKGKPLAGRAANIVLTKREDYTVEGAVIVHSVEEALEAASAFDPEDVFVIGGGEIYRTFLPYCDTAFITRIDCSFDADTFIPDLDSDPVWELRVRGEEQTCFDLIFTFDIYERKKEA